MAAYTRGQYHGRVPEWRSNYRSNSPTIGIELEVEHPLSYQRLLELLPEYKGVKIKQPITERDGSLLAGKGVEIVFPPYSRRTLRNKSSYFNRVVAALSTEIGVQRSLVGMHWNINTAGWSADKKNMFIRLVCCLPTLVVVALFGRRYNRYAQGVYSNTEDAHNSVAHPAVELYSNRLELRIPHSTLDRKKHARILKAIEFFEKISELVDHETFSDLYATPWCIHSGSAEFRAVSLKVLALIKKVAKENNIKIPRELGVIR